MKTLAKTSLILSTIIMISCNEEQKSVLVESEKRLAKEKIRVKSAIENGLATPFEREKISVAELNLASKRIELEGNLRLLHLKLSVLTGQEIGQIENYSFNLKPWLFKQNDQSYSNRPELEALRATIDAYEYKLKMNKNHL